MAEEKEEFDNSVEPNPPEDQPVEPESDQQPPGPTLDERVQDAQNQYSQAKDFIGKGKEKLAARAEKKTGKGALRGVEKEGAEAAKAAKGKVATQAGEKVGQAAVQTGAKTAATVGTEVAVTAGAAEAGAVAGSVVPIVGTAIGAIVGWLAGKLLPKVLDFVKNNWTKPVYVVAGVILLLAIPFGLIGLKGADIKPSTAAQETQVTAVSAISGNASARNTLVFRTIDAERTRMGRFKNWVSQVYGNDAGKAGGATTRIKEVTSLLDTLEITGIAAEKKNIVAQIQDKLASFATDFPGLIGYAAVHGYPLTVPGVIEAAGGDCGAASIIMVSLYYKQKPGDDVYDAPRRASRAQVCVSPNYLNEHSPFQDWTYATSRQAGFASVKKSLAAGNPVVLYVAPGGIYGPSKKGFGGKHIVVIVGYDPADQTFFINNPSPRKVDVATKTPNGRKMTESHLQQFLGDAVYNHSYIIRKAFL